MCPMVMWAHRVFLRCTNLESRKEHGSPHHHGTHWRSLLKGPQGYYLPDLWAPRWAMGDDHVTSQIFNLECYTLDHHCISYLLHFGWSKKFFATQGPSERVGDFVIFRFEFSQILRIGSFDFNYFIINYFYYKNMREGIKWLSQNK